MIRIADDVKRECEEIGEPLTEDQYRWFQEFDDAAVRWFWLGVALGGVTAALVAFVLVHLK